MLIELPWPPKALHPNARVHRMALAAARKKYRADCAWAARGAGATRVDWPGVLASFRFCPPDRRRRDLDGMLAAIKSGIDGIVDVIGVDDYEWSMALKRDQPLRGGAVIVGLQRWEEVE